MPRIIAVANQKGGVGKTTTTLNVGAALRSRGRKVLLIDMDPQECLGASLKIPTPEVGKSLSEVLLGEASLSNVIVESNGLSVAPAGADLAEVEIRLIAEPGGEVALREALMTLTEPLDYILIDCPPSLGLLTIATLTAAGEVLIPAQTEYLALRRLAAILRTIAKVKKRLNPALQVLGILPTLYDGRTLHSREVLGEIREILGGEHRVFDPIPRSIRFAEAPVAGRPIFEYAGDVEGARAYRILAEELDK